jgi:ribosomal protein L37AE/L43A
MESVENKIAKLIVNNIISKSNCPDCKGTLIGLRENTVVECNGCGKPFQRITDQDETYYVKLIKAH